MVTNANTSSHIKFWFPKVCLKRVFSPNVRESKAILDSGFHILDSRSQVLNFGYFVSGTGIPDFNRWWDSQAKLSRTLESRFPFTKEEVCMKAMTEDFLCLHFFFFFFFFFYAYIPCGLLDCRVLLASRTISSSSSPSSSKPPSSSPAVSPRPWSPACMFLRVASDSYQISTTKIGILVPFRVQIPLTFEMKLSAKFAFSLTLKQRLWPIA